MPQTTTHAQVAPGSLGSEDGNVRPRVDRKPAGFRPALAALLLAGTAGAGIVCEPTQVTHVKRARGGPLIALIVNVIRLIPTVLMYGYSTEDRAQLFHDISGWAMLVLAIGMLWSFLGLLRWLEVPINPIPLSKA